MASKHNFISIYLVYSELMMFCNQNTFLVFYASANFINCFIYIFNTLLAQPKQSAINFGNISKLSESVVDIHEGL